MVKTKPPAIFVAVHRVPHVTRAGRACANWSAYIVAAGPNPLGPRGGAMGNVGDGQFVSKRFSKREAAEAFATQWATEHGAQIVTR